MNITGFNEDFAKDWIDLINGAKNFEKNGHVSFIPKNSNKKTEYDWVLLDDILEYVKSNEKFALSQPLGQNENGEDSVKNIFIHVSGAIVESDWWKIGLKEDDNFQNRGIGVTYARRYSLGAILGLASETDNDGKVVEEQEDLVDKKSQKVVTDLFNKLVTCLGAKEFVYKELGTTREEFIIDFNAKPKSLIAPMKKWLKDNNVE